MAGPTRLEQFLKSRRIKPAHLAVDSGEVVTSDWNVLRRRIERDIFDR